MVINPFPMKLQCQKGDTWFSFSFFSLVLDWADIEDHGHVWVTSGDTPWIPGFFHIALSWSWLSLSPADGNQVFVTGAPSCWWKKYFCPFTLIFGVLHGAGLGSPIHRCLMEQGSQRKAQELDFQGFRALKVKCFNHISLDSAPKFVEFPEFFALWLLYLLVVYLNYMQRVGHCPWKANNQQLPNTSVLLQSCQGSALPNVSTQCGHTQTESDLGIGNSLISPEVTKYHPTIFKGPRALLCKECPKSLTGLCNPLLSRGQALHVGSGTILFVSRALFKPH